MELVQDRLNTMLCTSIKEQVALNKSSLLMKIHYNYLQS